MFSWRDLVVFLAGVEFFHTLSHILIGYFLSLPLDMKFVTLTSTMNIWAIVINGIITVALIWWATRLKK